MFCGQARKPVISSHGNFVSGAHVKNTTLESTKTNHATRPRQEQKHEKLNKMKKHINIKHTLITKTKQNKEIEQQMKQQTLKNIWNCKTTLRTIANQKQKVKRLESHTIKKAKTIDQWKKNKK